MLEKPPGDRSTIADVASLAGVSIKTVSRVLNKEPNVREITRANVVKAVRQLGYKPNFQARQLKSARSCLIGLLCGDELSSYAGPAQLGALEFCRDVGYHLVVEIFGDDDPAPGEALERMIRAARPEGVLLLPPFGDAPDVLEVVRRYAIPFCCLAPNAYPADGYVVQIDEEAAAYDITCHLIQLGHRAIAFIKGYEHRAATHNRLAGYSRALSENGINLSAQFVVEGDFSYRSGMVAAERLLERSTRPTAIFAGNDDMAAAVLASAFKHGMKVPEDLSVAGFDDSIFSRKIWPTITTVNQPVFEMAKSAVELLLSGISASDLAADERVKNHSYELLLRESTADLSSAEGNALTPHVK